MHYAFQDFDNLYLVLDLLTGGDLRYQISRHPKQFFSEMQTKFFVSCLIEALLYIHSKKVIHRDIKPENLVFDENGFLHITDFGIAKFITKNNSEETSGTPGYMAPEVMQGKNHTSSVDFYAVGVIIYELMMGKRPYVGKNRKEIKEQIMSKQVKISKMEIPENWSVEAADFANKLLIRKDRNRLGYNNEKIIKEHPWVNNVDWNAIKNKKINAPFLPKQNHDNYDKNYCEELEEINLDTYNRFEEYRMHKNYNDMFFGFTFYNINVNEVMEAKLKSSNIVIKNKKFLSNSNNITKIEKEDNKINNEDFENDKKYQTLKNINHNHLLNEQNLKFDNTLSKIEVKKDIINKDGDNNNNNKDNGKIGDLNFYSPINNYNFGYNKQRQKEKLLKIDNNKSKETKLKKSKSFSLNMIKFDTSNNSYLALLNQINLNTIKNKDEKDTNDCNKSINNSNSSINNVMMKLSTNFYIKHSKIEKIEKNEKNSENKKRRERAKSSSHNINFIIDKNKNDIKNKIKKLNTNKNFYKRKIILNKKIIENNEINNNISKVKKKLYKNYSQGNIKTNKTNVNKNIAKKMISNNRRYNSHHKSFIKSNSNANYNKSILNNNINSNKKIFRNSSLKKKNIAQNSQKHIPFPITSGKKFIRRKLGCNFGINLNDNNNDNIINYSIKNSLNQFTNEKSSILTNKSKKNKNLLNELSFNNNEISNNYNYNYSKIKASYNTINVDEKISVIKDSHRTLNSDLLFTIKKINSFKAFNKTKNNYTKLKKNKIKNDIAIGSNNSKAKNKTLKIKNPQFDNTNYKFKFYKKINTPISDFGADNQSRINFKCESFEINNNNYSSLTCKKCRATGLNSNILNNKSNINNNRNRNINQKCGKENSKNKKLKIKSLIGNYSNQSVYSTASTGQNKMYNK